MIPCPPAAAEGGIAICMIIGDAGKILPEDRCEHARPGGRCYLQMKVTAAGRETEPEKVDTGAVVAEVSRSMLTHVLDIVRGLEREYGTAKKEGILGLAVKEGIEEREAEKAIEKLKLEGHVFEPKFDIYKSV